VKSEEKRVKKVQTS